MEQRRRLGRGDAEGGMLANEVLGRPGDVAYALTKRRQNDRKVADPRTT
jgi:hypothetical protein